MLPEGDVPYAAIDGETGFKGTLSEKIEDAVSKMEELGTRSLGHKIKERLLFVKNIQSSITLSRVVMMDLVIFVEKLCSSTFFQGLASS